MTSRRRISVLLIGLIIIGGILSAKAVHEWMCPRLTSEADKLPPPPPLDESVLPPPPSLDASVLPPPPPLDASVLPPPLDKSALPPVAKESPADYISPRQVDVLPVFFVPANEKPPTAAQSLTLMRHLEWARKRYLEMLGGRDTFKLCAKPVVYAAAKALDYYRGSPEKGAPQCASELLQHFKFNRYTCPHIFVLVVMDPKNDFPAGCGQPFNGGLNTGGGILCLSSFALDRIPDFQSTLQHELGHTFGLPHVDAYGFNMQHDQSIMSYNLALHTKGFEISPTPGKLNPEDLRALALNQRVFPNLQFDASRDIPKGYAIKKTIIPLGPMTIAGQPAGVSVTTASGEEFESHVANIVQGTILPHTVMFDEQTKQTMWHSSKAPNNWVSVEVSFPMPVAIDQVSVHSQHGGEYHPAKALRLHAASEHGLKTICETELKSVDARVSFPKTIARTWKFEFKAGSSQYVVLRGLQFFCGEDEIFPPLVVYPF